MKYFIYVLFFSTVLYSSIAFKGFGLQVGEQGNGIFFHYTWHSNTAIKWLVFVRIFDVKGEDYFLIYNPHYNQSHSVGDKYILIINGFTGVKYFPFYDQIANNFSPYVTLQLGPVLTIDAKEDESFPQRWRRAKGLWSFGAHGGVGVDFLLSRGTIMTAGVGLDYLPMNGTVEGKTHYSGAVISFAINWLR